jgi:DNA (cytosine-5)-methyltransferase 1
MNFSFGELFCGPGGLAYAAKHTKVSSGQGDWSISHAWATDYDADTCETYRKNICPDAPETVICDDIRNLSFDKLKNISSIDALAFGFPCNDFSVVGEQKGIDGVFGPLYEYGVHALNFFSPKWFLAENVGGLRNSNDGKAFKQILRELSKDYEVVPHLYKFEKYGVPQARHRIIIIGIRKDLGLTFNVPSPEPFADVDVSAKTALTVPPIPKDALNQELTNQSQSVVNRLKHIKPGENAFTANLPKEHQLNVKAVAISSIYRRLDPDKPSYTVTGSGGGGTYVYHWEENRALTNRERARLQTFPDDYEFCGSKQSVRRQIGMAVPPKGVKVIFEAVLKTFAGIEYLSVPANISIEQLTLFDKDKVESMAA